MTEQEACVAFNLTDRIGSVRAAQLRSAAGGSLAAAWEAFDGKVSRSGGEVDWAGEFALARRYGVEIVTEVDGAYPARLREISGHPLVLYVKGDVAALSRPAIALVGTRRVTAYGRDIAGRFGHDLAAAGWTVVSGLALGVDAAAHRGALDAKGVTVGVIGSGLDRFYPEENRPLAREIAANGGAVVSEFPFGRVPDQQTFPIRNHTVAGLAAGVVAIEAPLKSGTLITTSIAADLGRTVMAVPGRITDRMSSGCLRLIREGAVAVCDADDVLEALGPIGAGLRPVADAEAAEERPAERSCPSADLPPFSVEEAMVMRHVTEAPLSMDELVQLTGLPVMNVNSLCMTLRIKGRLRFLPGNRVALPPSRG